MKKTFIIIAALLIAGSAYAQEESGKSAKDRLKEIEEMKVDAKKHKSIRTENKLFEAEVFKYGKYGWHKVDGADFRSKFGPSREIISNVLDLQLNPCSWLGIYTGLDLKWDSFTIKDGQFGINDGKLVKAAAVNPAPDYKYSSIKTFAYSIPAGLSFKIGEISLRIGADAVFYRNKYTKVKNKYEDGGTNYIAKTKGGKVEDFVFDYSATLNLGGIGIYYKYCPKQIVPGSDMIKNYQTIGIVLGL
ncbi:MAG: hypothetical protein K6F21_03410 [Bacteroidales bacterium]|nr:hypothetical protein [Bacteroidales bacterium]